jgi:hypothetical protein
LGVAEQTDALRSGLLAGRLAAFPAQARRGLFRSFGTVALTLASAFAFALAVASLRAREMAPALLGFSGATHFQLPGPPSILQPP